MPLYGWHSWVSYNKIAGQIKQKEQYVEAQIAPPRFSAYNLTTKWTFKPKRENLRLYFICSPPPAYSTMLEMSDAAKFGVYGQERASWVFIRGCRWTILRGHSLTKTRTSSWSKTFQLVLWVFHHQMILRLHAEVRNQKHQTPCDFAKSIIYVFGITLTTVSNKRPPPIVRPARNGMFDKKGDGTIVTENLAGANPGQVSRIVYPTISTKCLQALALTKNSNTNTNTTGLGGSQTSW